MRIDAHQHFWIYRAEEHPWINADMQGLARDFLPQDVEGLLQQADFQGCIAVQAREHLTENRFLLELAAQSHSIVGIVGWMDLTLPNCGELLADYALRAPLIRGFREQVESIAEPDYLCRPDFLKGMAQLTAHGYTYDLLIKPLHFQSTLACVRANPKQQFVLDHLAKPGIKAGEFDAWAYFIEELAACSNVACKISGYATLADWKTWTIADFTMYIQHVIACFGKDRILYGSDWPVSTLAASYGAHKQIAEAQLQDFSETEKEAFYGENARRIYQLPL